jgi:arylamine N-acetyltransferase
MWYIFAMFLTPASPLWLHQTPVFDHFCSRFGLFSGLERAELLKRICAAFAAMPFENLTKILSAADNGRSERRRRLPLRVVGEYLSFGTGGTCFSLNAACIAVLSHFGFEAWPLLCDRNYGANTHCAVLLMVDGVAHLLDPGYLMYTPLVLPTALVSRSSNGFNDVELTPRDGGERVELATIMGAQRRYRLTYKVQRIDEQTFLRAWDDSFAFDMMGYAVLTYCRGGEHCYLQGSVLRIRDSQGVRRFELTPQQQYEFLVTQTGIDAALGTRLLSVVGNGTAS